MNANAFHNILNVVAAVGGLLMTILMLIGCTQLANGSIDCSASVLPPQYAAWILGAFGFVKLVMNVGRDGVGGLFKTQPPVQK